ncbi:hypothetical protein DAEQUDRAFT_428840 [Daedalea quercina L-15889]|uniref:Uncharacterized protein n=1 Tax=Daedalea quercina L-15889 TaxID=1314783 RepID=A0A165NJN2_9APHY|nr:hypothetical protein DAEQUDRAFT_428840 [Daedalea quercina L-15889]
MAAARAGSHHRTAPPSPLSAPRLPSPCRISISTGHRPDLGVLPGLPTAPLLGRTHGRTLAHRAPAASFAAPSAPRTQAAALPSSARPRAWPPDTDADWQTQTQTPHGSPRPPLPCPPRIDVGRSHLPTGTRPRVRRCAHPAIPVSSVMDGGAKISTLECAVAVHTARTGHRSSAAMATATAFRSQCRGARRWRVIARSRSRRRAVREQWLGSWVRWSGASFYYFWRCALAVGGLAGGRRPCRIVQPEKPSHASRPRAFEWNTGAAHAAAPLITARTSPGSSRAWPAAGFWDRPCPPRFLGPPRPPPPLQPESATTAATGSIPDGLDISQVCSFTAARLWDRSHPIPNEPYGPTPPITTPLQRGTPLLPPSHPPDAHPLQSIPSPISHSHPPVGGANPVLTRRPRTHLAIHVPSPSPNPHANPPPRARSTARQYSTRPTRRRPRCLHNESPAIHPSRQALPRVPVHTRRVATDAYNYPPLGGNTPSSDAVAGRAKERPPSCCSSSRELTEPDYSLAPAARGKARPAGANVSPPRPTRASRAPR